MAVAGNEGAAAERAQPQRQPQLHHMQPPQLQLDQQRVCIRCGGLHELTADRDASYRVKVVWSAT